MPLQLERPVALSFLHMRERQLVFSRGAIVFGFISCTCRVIALLAYLSLSFN